MSKVQIPQDFSKVDQWVNFLNESAYRGYKVNRLSISLHKGNINNVKYLANTHLIQASSKKGPDTKIFIDQINKRWSVSRWNHERKMKNVNYAMAFNRRMVVLAIKLAEDFIKANPQAPIPIPTPGVFSPKP